VPLPRNAKLSVVWDITFLRVKQVPELQILLIAEGHKSRDSSVCKNKFSEVCLAHSACEDPGFEVASMAVPLLFAGVCCSLKKER